MFMLKSTHNDIVKGFEAKIKDLMSRIDSLHDLKNSNTEFFENRIKSLKESLELPEDELKEKILMLEDENYHLKCENKRRAESQARSMAQAQMSGLAAQRAGGLRGFGGSGIYSLYGIGFY